MRNLILFTVLLFSGFVSAQTFDFSCDDSSGIQMVDVSEEAWADEATDFFDVEANENDPNDVDNVNRHKTLANALFTCLSNAPDGFVVDKSSFSSLIPGTTVDNSGIAHAEYEVDSKTIRIIYVFVGEDISVSYEELNDSGISLPTTVEDNHKICGS